MRVGVLALLHESNTFIEQPTTMEHFANHLLLEGAAVREELADTHHEVGGFFSGLERETAAGRPIEAVPLYAARAVPYGAVDAATFEHLVERMLAAVRAAAPLDGLLVAPHGATVSVAHPDADGYWLAKVRQLVGPRVPIVGTLDAHANLSATMVSSCNALVAYRTNPHLDQSARGEEAARLIASVLRREVAPRMAAVAPPLAINIERQHTSESPCRELLELADRQREEAGILSNSVLLGFPYADVAEMGSSVLAVTDNDPDGAARAAQRLADALWRDRSRYVAKLLDVEPAIEQACRVAGPVCLLDMGDNVGGGSPGDSTHLVSPLLHRAETCFACLFDPQAAAQAIAAGVGNRVSLRVGGKTDQRHGQPLSANFEVLRVHDGHFEEHQPRHGGFTRCNQGPTAVVRHGQLTLLINSRRTPPFSLQQLLSCGIDPAEFQILVAKGVNAPVAAYSPVCAELIRVDTDGVTTADLSRLAYQHRRRPMFPFEPDMEWSNRQVTYGATLEA